MRAFSRVATQRSDVRLVIVHKPTYYHFVPKEYREIPGIHDTARTIQDLQRLAAELQVADRVEFIEALDKPDLYYSAADVLVVPFLHERFSSVQLLEGVAHGRPAIATDLGEQRELMVDGEHGLLVPPGNEAALAAAMRRLAEDEDARAAMGRRAAALAREHSVEESARRLTRLYKTLAAGHAAAGVPAEHRA